MRKWKWLLGLLALPLIYVVIVITLRTIGPSEEQKRAVVLMTTPPFEIERDAFAALWLMPFDVPEAELEAVARRDIEAFKPMHGAQPTELFQSLATQTYAKLPDWNEGIPSACQSYGRECREKLQADPQPVLAWIERNQQRLRKIEALQNYDGLGFGFEPAIDAPIPAFSGIQTSLAISAIVQFDRGEQVQALDRVCRHAQTWRQLGAQSGTLIGKMVAVAFVRQSAELIAEFLSEIPPTAALPDSCVSAFESPLPIDTDQCAAMQGELRYFDSAIRTSSAGESAESPNAVLAAIQNGLFFDTVATTHFQATLLAPFCDAGRHAGLLLDREGGIRPPKQECSWRERAHNWVGCVLVAIGAPAYDDYQNRILDHAARIRLMGGLLWWRAQSDDSETAEARLARMPAEFFSAERPIELVEEGRALRIPLYYRKQDAYWQIPLSATVAGAWAAPAAAGELRQ